MSLESGRQINCSEIKVLPITDHIIVEVERLAEADGVQSLKFTAKVGGRFIPADWFAGVDYEDNSNEAQDNSDSDSSSDSEEIQTKNPKTTPPPTPKKIQMKNPLILTKAPNPKKKTAATPTKTLAARAMTARAMVSNPHQEIIIRF